MNATDTALLAAITRRAHMLQKAYPDNQSTRDLASLLRIVKSSVAETRELAKGLEASNAQVAILKGALAKLSAANDSLVLRDKAAQADIARLKRTLNSYTPATNRKAGRK